MNVEHYKDYIARNKNGDLVLFLCSYWMPWRKEDFWINNEWVNLGAYSIGTIVKDNDLLEKYKELTWENNPIKIN